MSDLISRQAAINAVCENCEYRKNEKVVNTLMSLPAADVPTLKQAIDKIQSFLDDECNFLATSMCKMPDGTILITDWGYVEDGLKELSRWVQKTEGE